jgi:dihydrodipicolinate synthase/N-acetylneuraminate lyase
MTVARFDHLKGVFGLLPTPYNSDYSIHAGDLRAAAEFCCRSGQHGIVWPVMVGEFYFLGDEERVRHLDAVLDTVNGRLPVVFGCSANSLPQTVAFGRAAQRAGADAVIAMPPPYADFAVARETFHRLADSFAGPVIVQNAAERISLTAEQLATLVDEVPLIEYIKEERPPGTHHISEVHRVLGGKVKTIFGGVGGKMLPEELSRGAGGSMPACELADVLAKVMQLWWDRDEQGARLLHQRLLPLIMRESHPFMRYILKRRGVFTSTIERGPGRSVALDDEDRREIAILAEAIRDDLDGFPFRFD